MNNQLTRFNRIVRDFKPVLFFIWHGSQLLIEEDAARTLIRAGKIQSLEWRLNVLALHAKEVSDVH